MEVINEKNKIRLLIKSRISSLSREEKFNQSSIVSNKIINSEIFKKSKNLCLYFSMDNEICLEKVITCADKLGKNLFFPKVDGNELQIIQYIIGNPLCENHWKIKEPNGVPLKNLTIIDCIIVPCVAFDNHANRLGHGKGYYDRLLAKIPNTFKLGVAFKVQQVDRVPCDTNDIKLDNIVTN